ncbi:MAG TPA: hypothetical protein VH350_04075 [Candidatus Sulfotelmatobacter sp.]|nr:hypothetical protein [Candidatus Sulfotelmatobacter sp.]
MATLMALSCAEFTVEYLKPFAESIVSTADTSLEIVPVPLNRSTGTAVVVDAVAGAPVVESVDAASLVPVALGDVVVDAAIVVPLDVVPEVAGAVVVVVDVAEPFVDADGVGEEVVVVDSVGSGTGCALAAVPSVEPGVPHAVKTIGTTAISPKTIARCRLFADRGNETTGTS